MLGKGSKLYSVVRMKCPSCHEGDFFITKNPYDLKHIADMHSRCPKCNQTYEPEPNFYQGAMYVSYVFTVGIFMLVVGVCQLVLDMKLWTTVGTLAGVLVIGGPYLFRLSRITWLNVFVKYKKN